MNNVCQQPPPFVLNYDGDTTQSLSPAISAANLQTVLNGLDSISSAGSVTVTLESSDNRTRVYRVKFNFAQPDSTSMLEAMSQYVNIAVSKTGINSAKGFRLGLGGKRTKVIHPNTTKEELEGTFSQLFSTECTFSADTGKFYIVLF